MEQRCDLPLLRTAKSTAIRSDVLPLARGSRSSAMNRPCHNSITSITIHRSHTYQRLRIAAQRVLQQVRQLEVKSASIGRSRSPQITFEFLYGICFSPFSPFSPSAAMTSPSALKLLLMLCVSFSRSLSPAAPLELRRSLPAKSTRFRLPSQLSPVCVFVPDSRSVKTECEREERSFISVAATVRRELATRRREVTYAGDGRGITFTSVTRVPDLSCFISCFFLSNSPLPRRSLIVSLYYDFLDQCLRHRQDTHDLEELAVHPVLPAFRLEVLGSSEHLVHRTGYHACRSLGLRNQCVRYNLCV